MSDLRPIGSTVIAELGDMLVSAQATVDSSDQLHDEYIEVLDDLRVDRKVTKALLRMSWVALRAIERCRQLEESDASDRTGRGDARRPRDDVPAAVARVAPDGGPTPRASA